MKYFRKIQGENVYLSPYNLDDLEVFTKWMNDRAVTDGLGDSAEQFNLINEKKWLEDMLEKGEPCFAIISEKNDELIGSMGLFEIKQIHGSAMVGIYIGDAENRGKGYGTEAMKLLINYAFNVLNLRNIMLNVFEFNENAYNSYLKVGFKEIGRRRKAHYHNGNYFDIISMDITREDLL
ncbi:MAG: GNAT family N-acetyltransferase [Oscillospiraceae bacterium]|nr:GNAT family N-acetyltransferase [Oscillospiraceae bacterium]